MHSWERLACLWRRDSDFTYAGVSRKLQDLLTSVERPVELNPAQTYRLVTAKRYRAGIVPREVL